MRLRQGIWGVVELCLAWTLMLATVSAFERKAAAQTSSIATTQIADTVYLADGGTATGTVLISWPSFTTAGGSAVPAGTTSVTIGTGGALSVQLVANAGSTPIGSYYTVVYHLGDGTVTREYWVVPARTTATTVSAIRSTVLPTSVAMQTVSKAYVDTAIATAAATGFAADDPTEPYVLRAGDTMTGPLVLPGDPTSPLQAAEKQYVDEQVAAVASGLNQKVSTLPSATQTVVQPTGTNLAVNILNGVEYASQYVNGAGNNGIANAVASTDCANGCTVVAEPNYASTETPAPTTWNNKTAVLDERNGSTYESFLNPFPLESPGTNAAKTIQVDSTQNVANILATTGIGAMESSGLVIASNALAGGSNVNPAHIQAVIPYFKTTYNGFNALGTNNTIGQHILLGASQDCYGVGDCLVGGYFMRASGGFRDEADEGAHPFDLGFTEDTRVFEGTCASGCTTGSTTVQVTPTANGGTQGEGRYLLDLNPAKVIATGSLTGGTVGGRQPSATFTGTSFPVSTLLETAQTIPTQAQNISPGTVTFAIVTSGVPAGFASNTAALPASSGVACVADVLVSPQPMYYETATYTVVDASHLQMTLLRPHANGATVAVGGLCGYGLEQTVDTLNGIRQVFPVIASTSATSLLYAGGGSSIVGQQATTSSFVNASLVIASIARTSNVVTVTTAGNFPEDFNGLTLTVQGVTDSSYNGSFNVTTTGPNTLTYAETGANSTSAGGTMSVLTGGFALYPMAEAVSVYNATTKAVDGQMTLAPNTVAWASGDSLEMPHYFQESVHADSEGISQFTPRANATTTAGLNYNGNAGPGLVGWNVDNTVVATNYFGNGGTHTVPSIGMEVSGIWNHSMELQAGETAAIEVHCNSHGCNKWNSGYNLFQMDTSVGEDGINYSPATSTLNFSLRGTSYQFTPSGLTLGTLNVTTLTAGTINGSAPGSGSGSVTQAAVSSALTNTTYSDLIVGLGTGTPTPGTITGGGGYYGDSNTLIGANAGAAITTAREMTVLGANACKSYAGYSGTTALSQTENGLATCIGSAAGAALVSTGFDSSVDDVFVGQKAGTNTINGQSCTYLGTHTGTSLTGCLNSTVAGGHSLNDNGTIGGTASGVTVFGSYAANGVGSKTNDTVVGASAALNLTTGSNEDCMGEGACGNLTSGSNNEVIGFNAAPGLVAGSNLTVFGNQAGPNVDASQSVYIGSLAGYGVTGDNGSVTAVGWRVLSGGGTCSWCVFVGDYVASQGGGGAVNQATVVGSSAGYHLGTSYGNSFFGFHAGQNVSTGSYNSLVGSGACTGLTTGSGNLCFGQNTGYAMAGAESNNVMIGNNATTASGVTGAVQIGGGSNGVSNSFQVNSTPILDGNADLHASTATPADNATCTAGAARWDANYIYICVAANTWKRAALTTY